MVLAVIRYLLLVVEVTSSILLIGVILLQKSKQQGAGMAFGSGVGESLFGAQVGNVLTKTTVILAVIFLANTTLLAYIGSNRARPSVADGMPAPTVLPPTASPFAGGAPGSAEPSTGIPTTAPPSIPASVPEGAVEGVPGAVESVSPVTAGGDAAAAE